MEKTSYLLFSKRKIYNISSRIMEKQSSSDSNISLDSLENSVRINRNRKSAPTEDNVDTILVPFYEHDVLIKVPKDSKKRPKPECNKLRKDGQFSNSYLVKKDVKKDKRTTYLEIFRKQFFPTTVEKKEEVKDVSSLAPEFGDTERESISDGDDNPVTEFYNTEAYNEIYYEKILNQEIETYLESSFEEGLRFTENIRSKSPDDAADNNLRSVSEVSQPRRTRRATVQPLQNVKLGGLGPDMEKIKPRLERARSLQRYSEKVRMENRLKIYKKSIQAEIEKKAERETSAKHRDSAKRIEKEDQNISYLVNKSAEESKPKKVYTKSKSACVQTLRDRNIEKEKSLFKNGRSNIKTQESSADQEQKEKSKSRAKSTSMRDKAQKECNDLKFQSIRSSSRSRGINTDNGIPPLQINFSVNVDGVRPSSALRSLEEKHRMYQEKVKSLFNNV